MKETPAVRAEQALLGSILSDEYARATGKTAAARPRMLDRVAGWIRPGDYLRPYHAAVWSALLNIRQRGQLATPEAVRAELAHSPELGPQSRQDATLVHQLMEAAPVAGRAETYGGMVVEAALHRRMHSTAARLETAAHSNDRDRIAAARAQAQQQVEMMRTRWDQVPPAVRVQLDRDASWQAGQPSPAELQTEARRLAEQLQQAQAKAAEQRAAGRRVDPADLTFIELLGEMLQRLLSLVDHLATASVDGRHGAQGDRAVLAPGQSISGQWNQAFISRDADALARGDEQHQAETTEQMPAWRAEVEGALIGSVIRDPRQLDMLDLSGEEFADPAARQMYAAARDIHHAGGAVDEITVAWHVQRAGGDVERTNEVLQQAVRHGIAGQAGHLATELRALAIGDRARQTAEAMRQAAVDPRVPPARMLAQAETELATGPVPAPPTRDVGPVSPGREPSPAQPQRRTPEHQPEKHPASRELGPHRRRRRVHRPAEHELGL